jgi:phosphatidylinositol alpha-mannosyltransferase
MRIALLHPTYWPEVLRGSERIVHDLGSELATRGHEVTLITSHPGRATESEEDGMRVIRARRPPRLPGAGVYEHHIANAPNVARRLRNGRFEVVHAFFPVDSWVAVQRRIRGGPPVVATLHGIPTRQYLVARRYRLQMLLEVAARADACTVLSEAAARPFRDYLLRDPLVVPPGVQAGRYASPEPRSSRPTIVCAASLGDPRKRGSLLADAFALLRSRVPEVRMLVLRGRDPILSRGGIILPEGAEWLEPVHRPEELAPIYASAWASVLPSFEEAFGVVLTESLAAGTPVVADRTGAGPEIVTDERIGRLFEGDGDRAREDLARALVEALELGARPETADLCRSHAAGWDWGRVVAGYEAVYHSVIGLASSGR